MVNVFSLQNFFPTIFFGILVITSKNDQDGIELSNTCENKACEKIFIFQACEYKFLYFSLN